MIEINISNTYSSTIELNDELINQGSLRANEFFITAEFAKTYEELTRYVCTFNFRRNDNVEINGLVATPVMRNSKWGWYYIISSKDITALDGDLHLTIKLNNLNEDEVITTTSFTLHVEHNAIGEEQVLINDAQYNSLLDKFNFYLTKDAVDFTDKEVNINIDGSPKGVYASLSALQTAFPSGASGVYLTSDNGHWYYWNGSAWTDGGLYLSTGNAVPETRTIAELPLSSDISVDALNNRTELTPVKNSSTKKEKVICENPGYINTSGSVVSNVDWAYSGLIDVKYLERHVYAFFTPLVATFAFYNSAEEFIGYYTENGTSGNYLRHTFVEVPSEAKYFRFICHIADEYDVNILTPMVSEKDFDYVEHIVVENVLMTSYPNTGYYLNTIGTPVANADWSYSDYIDIDLMVKEVRAFFLPIVGVFCFYDENKQFIGCFTKNAPGGNYMQDAVLTFPPRCKYVRIVKHNADENTIYIKQPKFGIDNTLTKEGYAADAKATGDLAKGTQRDLYTAGYVGFANFTYSEENSLTNSNFVAGTLNVLGNVNGYTNGSLIKNSRKIKGVHLIGNITSTTFNIFITDSNFNILKSILNYTPTITNNNFDLEEPLIFDKDIYMFIAFTNGTWELQNIGSKTLKEIRSGTTVVDSPIKAPFEVIYNDIESMTFKNDYKTLLPQIKISDFTMPKVEYADGEYCLIGRWFELDGKKCANADGSSIMFKVRETTSITIDFEPISEPNYTPYFAYSIDGSTFTRQLITNQTITLPDTEEHFVWIVVDGMGENDPNTRGKWWGTVGLKLNSLTAGSGGILLNVSPKSRKIMFFGDSIVEGINVLGEGANAETNSATNGFAFRTARKLNCIPLMAGYGASGILLNGSFAKTIDVLKYNKGDAFVNNMNPDIVFIESGVNDNIVISQGVYTLAQFEAGYKALIEAIMRKYPGVPICCMIPFTQVLADTIRACAGEYDCAYVIETSDFTVSRTDGSHPDIAGAINAALHLSEKLIDLLGTTFFLNV